MDKNRHSIKIPHRNIPHSYPLKGAVMYTWLGGFLKDFFGGFENMGDRGLDS